jgi:RNA polymerase sigma factor (sigma-70 family)
VSGGEKPPLTETERALVEGAVDMLPRIARAVRVKVRTLSESDLIGIGHDALCDAVRRYDPATGVAFRSFAWQRVYGEMLDQAVREAKRAGPPRAALGAVPCLADRVMPCVGDRQFPMDPGPQLDGLFAAGMLASAEDELLAGMDLRRAVDRALAELPEREARAIWLVCVDGMTQVEAAKALNAGERSVQRWVARATPRLQVALESVRMFAG